MAGFTALKEIQVFRGVHIFQIGRSRNHRNAILHPLLADRGENTFIVLKSKMSCPIYLRKTS